MEHCDTDYYADDTTVHINGKNEITVQAKLQLNARIAEFWSKQNKMYLSYDKTTCMLIETRYRTQNSQQLDIYTDNKKIKSVNKRKLVGIYIDENLLWSDHIDYLCSNISSKIFLLKQLSSYIPFEAQKCSQSGIHSPIN